MSEVIHMMLTLIQKNKEYLCYFQIKHNFQGRKAIRVKEGQYKMINRSFIQEGITTSMCSTQPQSIKIYDVKTYRFANRKHRRIHYYS